MVRHNGHRGGLAGSEVGSPSGQHLVIPYNIEHGRLEGSEDGPA